LSRAERTRFHTDFEGRRLLAKSGADGAWKLGGRSDRIGLGSLDEPPNTAAKVVLGDVESRDEPDHLIVRAAGDEQHVAIERAVARGLGGGLVGEFDRGHRAGRPDLAHAPIAFQRRQLLDDDLADEVGALDEALLP